MSYLDIQGISKRFKQRQVVDSVSFSVRSGQVVGLFGPNGAGKTTSFYIAIGLLTPDEGRVELDGVDIGQKPMFERARLGLSYLPQEASIFRRMTVSENILVALEVQGYRRSERRERLQRLLEDFKMSHMSHSHGYTLSGGERRRVEIARALAGQPKFLLLDEPFAGIDPKAMDVLKKMIRTLIKDQGIGILITDHNVREVLGICDKVYILGEGKVEVEGTAQEVVENPIARERYLGENFIFRQEVY